MASRRPPGWLEQLLASGELHRIAARCRDENELAQHIGVSRNAIYQVRHKARSDGRHFPSFDELRNGVAATATDGAATADDFANEPPTEPGIPLPVLPERHIARGVSTLVDAEGNIKQQWIKTSAVNDEREALLDAVRRIADEWPVIPEATAPPLHSDDDLLCVYPMGDPHLGMLAWAPETGENFDLAIAERNLVAAVDHLALLAPPAKRALVATVGDTFHSDGLSNTTTKGTRVDVDGRTAKMIDVGVRTFRRVIDRALLHHEEVEVKIAPGNHDALLSIVLQVALRQFYEHEPRVHVDPSPEAFLWYRFGLNLIGINHGDRAKADALMQAMAVDCAKDWGETRHRRMYTGHVHHETTKEVPGCTVDTLNTLASSDDWHRRQAYRATRHMRMDIIHREFGLINRHIVGIDQLLRRSAA